MATMNNECCCTKNPCYPCLAFSTKLTELKKLADELQDIIDTEDVMNSKQQKAVLTNIEKLLDAKYDCDNEHQIPKTGISEDLDKGELFRRTLCWSKVQNQFVRITNVIGVRLCQAYYVTVLLTLQIITDDMSLVINQGLEMVESLKE